MGFPNTPYIPHTTENGVKDLYLEFTTTTSGTIGVFNRGTGKGLGYPNVVGQTAPAAKSGVGQYSIRLSDNWQAFLGAQETLVGGTPSSTTGLKMRINTVTLTGATPGLTLSFLRTDTQAAAEVPDGTTVLIKFSFKDSTV